MKNIDMIRNNPILKKSILFLSSFCVVLSFVGYVGLLLYLVISKQYINLFKTILIPLSTIIIVEVIRHIWPRTRPFASYGYEPLISHDPQKSFPSKHSTSALIIALSIYRVFPLLGILYVVNALIVGLTRIFSGIHYPSDVCGGYILSLLMNLLYLL